MPPDLGWSADGLGDGVAAGAAGVGAPGLVVASVFGAVAGALVGPGAAAGAQLASSRPRIVKNLAPDQSVCLHIAKFLSLAALRPRFPVSGPDRRLPGSVARQREHFNILEPGCQAAVGALVTPEPFSPWTVGTGAWFSALQLPNHLLVAWIPRQIRRSNLVFVKWEGRTALRLSECVSMHDFPPVDVDGLAGDTVSLSRGQ